ncbi:hypothetical protein FGO68_gene89 [Halteria grandinella]|uniref:Uncharacterized protein n=1 Tax=Halteria grandinella TaxID=5974 RepID=A0A8J8NE38_HALGN|nr:hypothetical protein FGO68_gene89 [Halteria grandinella]
MKVETQSTTQPKYYQSSVDESAFQYLDPSVDTLTDALLQDPLCVLLCYNQNSEASLTSLKTKWMPLLQKSLNKAALKLGLILVGFSFTSDSDCSFSHKVALFARGFSLNGKTVTYNLATGEGLRQLKDLIKSALEKVSALGNQSFTTESNAPPESSRSKSIMMPTEDSVQKPIVIGKAIEQSGEIEDIIKAAAAVSAQVKKEVEKPLPEIAPKKVEVEDKKKVQDDDYDEDFE